MQERRQDYFQGAWEGYISDFHGGGGSEIKFLCIYMVKTIKIAIEPGDQPTPWPPCRRPCQYVLTCEDPMMLLNQLCLNNMLSQHRGSASLKFTSFMFPNTKYWTENIKILSHQENYFHVQHVTRVCRAGNTKLGAYRWCVIFKLLHKVTQWHSTNTTFIHRLWWIVSHSPLGCTNATWFIAW